VIGHFNLSSLVWSQDPEHYSSLPSSIHQPHEILFIDDIFSTNLIQVNNIFNSSVNGDIADVQECIDPSLHEQIRIKNTTLLKAICGPTTLGTQEQIFPRALDFDALNVNPEIVDRAIVGMAPLNIYFQNISGMRT